MIAQQTSFAGGMNLLDDDTALQDDQYRFLVNGRQRFGFVQPTQQAVEQDTLPAGNYQGGIGLGNVAIVFISGLAWYKYEGTTQWFQIAGFSMDAVVERLYACSVPKSTYDYIRKVDASINAPMIVTTDFKIAGNPAGIVVQDTINQPWLIEFNATTQQFVARVTKTYAQWANTGSVANSREYVPIGRQMMYMNQKLYIVARDGKSIYHSITGRPLDFMVNVDRNGNKLPAAQTGGADSVSFTFDSDEITCIKTVNIPDTFAYCTGRRVRLVTLDYTRTIFDEPRYRQTAIIESGVVNQESFMEILGDYVFMDFEGVKSFNAVQTLQLEGRNSIFSLMVEKLYSGRRQELTACAYFDNFALFYGKTNYGNGIAVYDALRRIWVGLDITRVTRIKQFFTTQTDESTQIYAVTDNNKLWQLYSSDTPETVSIHLRSEDTEDIKKEHKGQLMKLIYRRGHVQSGTVRLTELVDEKLSNTLEKTLTARSLGINYPVIPPVIPNNNNIMLPLTFIVTKGLAGSKIAYIAQWNSDAQLMGWQSTTTEQNKDVGKQQVTDE